MPGGSAGRDDDVARLRVPPHSIEAEQSVLGGLLIDNSAWDRAGDLLSESDFYRFEHKQIFAAVGKLIAERAIEKGVKDVVFDRGEYIYHGRVKALAEAAREAGLNF